MRITGKELCSKIVTQSKPYRMRNHSTDRSGNSFSLEVRWAVWQKAIAVPGSDANKIRKDRCGAWIEWARYGDTTHNGQGWEIDHIRPVAKGGQDYLENLQPLQWQNNRTKGDTYPALDANYCSVSAKR